MDKDTLATIAKHVEDGNCLLFIGAAVHAPPPKDTLYTYPERERPPLGGALGRQLAKRLLKSDKPMARKFQEECRGRLTRLAHFAEAELPDLFTELSTLLEISRDDRESDLRSELLLECLPDLSRVALYYETTFDRNQLVEEVASAVEGTGGVLRQPSPALRALAELNLPIIITTNYDSLFERALSMARKQPHIIAYRRNEDTLAPTTSYPGRAPSDEKPLVFKIHGDIVHDRDSIVVTDEDYIQFVLRMRDKEPFNPIPMTVSYHLQIMPVLFIGYSLMDYNLRLLLKTIRRPLDQANRQPAYAVDRSPDPLIFELWQEQKKDVDFIVQDVWRFVPALYQELTGKEMPQ